MKYRKIIGTLLVTLSISFFTPMFSREASAQAVEPSIEAQYAIALDAETGEIIYAKNADEKAYPASTTKLLTALLLAENSQKEDSIPFTETALSQPAYSFYDSYGPIPLGTTMSADNVMKALLLYSGNDVAYMVADYAAEDSESFVEMMNDKVKDWGLENTHFTNPNGLHNAEHYTTAYDLAIITQKAYENSWVREVMGLAEARVTTSNNVIVDLENRNKNITLEECVGGKTGYTSQAGKCLAAVYEENGRTIIGVVMKSIYDAEDTQVFKDMNAVMDYSFNAEKEVYKAAGTELGTVDVSYKLFKFFGPEKTVTVPLTLSEDIEVYPNTINEAEFSGDVQLSEKDAWKLASNNEAGTYNVTDRLYTSNYSVTAGIKTSDLVKANMTIYVISVVAIILAVVLIILIAKIASKAPRRKKRYKRNRRRY